MDSKLILYAGRAVLLRNRLQTHFYGRTGREPSPWFEEFTEEPHNHIVFASAWLVDRHELQVAEATLIDVLKPIRCKVGFGFSHPAAWTFRAPDIECIDPIDITPHPSRPRHIGTISGVPNKPGVYTWWVDRGAEQNAIKGICEKILKNP